MKIEITTRCVLHLPLTIPQVDTLMTLSQHHYDAKCKMASNGDGFLTRWRRMIEASLACEITDSTIAATMDEVDTCLKLLEMRMPASSARLIERDISNQLDRNLWGAMTLANSKYNDWQAIYEGDDG